MKQRRSSRASANAMSERVARENPDWTTPRVFGVVEESYPDYAYGSCYAYLKRLGLYRGGKAGRIQGDAASRRAANMAPKPAPKPSSHRASVFGYSGRSRLLGSYEI